MRHNPRSDVPSTDRFGGPLPATRQSLASNPAAIITPATTIEINGLSEAVPSTPALDGANIEVGRGAPLPGAESIEPGRVDVCEHRADA